MGSKEEIVLSVEDDVVLIRYPDGTQEYATFEVLGRSPRLVQEMQSGNGGEVSVLIFTGYMQSWLRCVSMMPQHLRTVLQAEPLDVLLLGLKVTSRWPSLTFCMVV
jgi:hypothetical protein